MVESVAANEAVLGVLLLLLLLLKKDCPLALTYACDRSLRSVCGGGGSTTISDSQISYGGTCARQTANNKSDCFELFCSDMCDSSSC